MKLSKKLKKGFTLVELLVVMAIIGILMLIGVPRFMKMTDSATKTTLEANHRITLGAMQSYKAEKGVYPTTFAELVTAGYVSNFNGTNAATASPRGAVYTVQTGGGLTGTVPIGNSKAYTIVYDAATGQTTVTDTSAPTTP